MLLFVFISNETFILRNASLSILNNPAFPVTPNGKLGSHSRSSLAHPCSLSLSPLDSISTCFSCLCLYLGGVGEIRHRRRLLPSPRTKAKAELACISAPGTIMSFCGIWAESKRELVTFSHFLSYLL